MHMFYYNQYLYETLWLWEKKKSSHASMFYCNINDYNWRPLVPNVGQGFCRHGLNKATDFPFISAWDLLFCLRYGSNSQGIFKLDKTLKTKPIRDFFHYLPKLYIGFINTRMNKENQPVHACSTPLQSPCPWSQEAVSRSPGRPHSTGQRSACWRRGSGDERSATWPASPAALQHPIEGKKIARKQIST